MQILTYIYSAIGIIGMIFTLVDRYKKRFKEENNMSYQIANIIKTLKEQDKDISKIEQEQDKQNISMAELHTKLDMLCKSSNIDKNKK
jgi:hypothetical protein